MSFVRIGRPSISQMAIAARHIGMLAFGFDHLGGDIELRITGTSHLFTVGMATDTLCTRIVPCPIAQQSYNNDKLEKKDDEGFTVNLVAEGSDLHAQLRTGGPAGSGKAEEGTLSLGV